MFSKSLFIFRRDFRLHDNTALREACASSNQVTAAFIADPRQLSSNEYRGWNSVAFMVASLQDLERQLQEQGGTLNYFTGTPEEVLRSLLPGSGIEAVFTNTDYTPFARARDTAVAQCCAELGVAFTCCHDVLLHSPGTVLKGDGGPYTVFTPFFKRAAALEAPKPQRFTSGRLTPDLLPGATAQIPIHPPQEEVANTVRGGRTEGLACLKRATALLDYADRRDVCAEPGTSRLSPHLKFGTVSIRETYHTLAKALGANHPLIRQLFWRDFFYHIAFHFPHVFSGAFHRKYDTLEWENNPDQFQAWCAGRTGFPMVDAGMRELRETGFMHNRARMVTASFLTKDLRIDWRWGEKYFAQHLTDYDPAINNGSWQWSASTGCDAQPYFRVFNPWIQQKRFDPDCVYIKRWIPELRDYSPAAIHALQTGKALLGYPAAIVDHREAKDAAEEMFEQVGAAGSR